MGAAKTENTVQRGDDSVAPYSSRGPSWYGGFAKPDVIAPGRALTAPAAPGSTLATEHPSLLVAAYSEVSEEKKGGVISL